MFNLLMASAGICVVGRGILLAARRSSAAASWIALGAAGALALTLRIPLSVGPPALVLLGAAATAGLAGLVVADRLRRDHVAALEATDTKDVERLLVASRSHRLSRRQRSRRRSGWAGPPASR